MLWWIKSGQIEEQQEIGKRLAKDTSTVMRWLQKYRTDGISGLLEIKKALLVQNGKSMILRSQHS
ncbi:MAG: helix-turn-helix domain-containing protein [Nostoc sp.]|uniref:helix-turn-helix domain-containing protein n=1 Tax=Nostoc sp. TaxID=1180 RepID=UPI002FFA0787